jgi:hypothetical protein
VEFSFLCQIIATEAFHNYSPRSNGENRLSGFRLTSTCYLPVFVVLSYQIIGIFLFGLAITQAVTDICKYSIGRLRPHFLDVCRPNISSVACDSASGLSVYIDNFTCSGTTGYAYDDSRWVLVIGIQLITAEVNFEDSLRIVCITYHYGCIWNDIQLTYHTSL